MKYKETNGQTLRDRDERKGGEERRLLGYKESKTSEAFFHDGEKFNTFIRNKLPLFFEETLKMCVR